MGAVPGIARPQHMSVGIGSGTDSLCFQGFQRVGCRHLTWHYTVEIFFQRKLIYHCNSVCGPQQLYMPSVRRCSLTSIHIDQPYPAGQHCQVLYGSVLPRNNRCLCQWSPRLPWKTILPAFPHRFRTVVENHFPPSVSPSGCKTSEKSEVLINTRISVHVIFSGQQDTADLVIFTNKVRIGI